MQPAKNFIARENIDKGDAVRLLWKRFCRRANSYEYIRGIAYNKAKKGGKIAIIQTLDNYYITSI